MNITIWGTRGSYPVCRQEVMKYGGNTTCLSIEVGNQFFIIDGGTGIARLGQHLLSRHESQSFQLFLTHPHWDHVMGLPFFSPFYNPDYTVNIYGSDSENKRLEEIFSFQHKEQSFPIPFESLKANINLNQIDQGDIKQFEQVKVIAHRLNHPGVNLGYRVESPQGTFVLLTDLAPIENNYLGQGMAKQAEDNPKDFEDKYYNDLVSFIQGADLVMHDTNFTKDEIVGRHHWGHSTPEDALQLLSQLDQPPMLILSHHDPNHPDDMMDAIYEHTRLEGKRRGIEVMIAKEGGQFKL